MKRIYFIPRYIGALKYYEKLFSALAERGCAPAFLLFEDGGMIEYCRARNLPYDDRFAREMLGHVPVLSHFLRERRIFNGLGNFLDETRPQTLVTEPSVGQRERALFALARRRAIPTIALQWAQPGAVSSMRHRPFSSILASQRARYGSIPRAILYSSYLRLLSTMFFVSDLIRGEEFFIHKTTHVDRLGAIDRRSRDHYVNSGWNDGQTRIVGSADFTTAAVLAGRATTDTAFRESLLRKYGLSDDRKKILVISTPFHEGFYAVFLDADGQRKYYSTIFEDIRSVFSSGEADILFKLHPRESPKYATFEKDGVRVFHNESNLDELITISDLYIAHPTTAANFIIRASRTPAIFINFSHFLWMDDGKDIYNLRSIVKTHDALRSYLAQFRAGKLPIQYESSEADTRSIDNIAEFIVHPATAARR